MRNDWIMLKLQGCESGNALNTFNCYRARFPAAPIRGEEKMSKWVRRTSFLLIVLALTGVAATVVGKALGERKMGRTVVLPVAPLDVAFEVALRAAPDAGRIERGRYLYDTRGCAECHGVDGAGKTFVKDGGMFVVAPNITAGANGVTVRYTALDWVRTLRHGVKPNGNPVLLMPSEDYSRLSGDDM